MRLIDADRLAYDQITEDDSYLTISYDEIKETPTIEAMPISFIKEITERDICLVYRGCLLMLLDKWEREKDTYVER